ncbi:MAG: DUF1365 domain-containing protein [Phycisphaerales bacterium]|nr:MAG: DUF1365 domain-containing protein [Phycisphaerales bacterium]
MHSAIYEGTVRHRRFAPVSNEFTYRLFMMYIDLTELSDVFRGRLLWSTDHFNLAYLRRRDHLGDPAVSIDDAARRLVAEQTGQGPTGPIRLLTHLRYFGHCFNPVSLFYCYDPPGQNVETIVAEVMNTPWHERHCYVLSETLNEDRSPWKRYRFPKIFHVSPFIDMNVDYDWRFLEPGDRLQIHMADYVGGNKLFDATLSLRRKPITSGGLAHVLVRYPIMTVQVVAKIHWQALRLWLKGAPFYVHPKKRPKPEGDGS